MIVTGQTATSSTAASLLCNIPPGPASVVIANVGPATVSVGPTPGAGESLLLGNGLLVLPGVAPTSFNSFASSHGASLSFCSTAQGSVATLSFLISTGQ